MIFHTNDTENVTERVPVFLVRTGLRSGFNLHDTSTTGCPLGCILVEDATTGQEPRCDCSPVLL